MGRRRERRKEERATFGRKGTANRYQMREKLVAFGDDYYIHNESRAESLQSGWQSVAGARYAQIQGYAGQCALPDPGAYADDQRHDGHRRWSGQGNRQG